jgi:hypothetical protein
MSFKSERRDCPSIDVLSPANMGVVKEGLVALNQGTAVSENSGVKR